MSIINDQPVRSRLRMSCALPACLLVAPVLALPAFGQSRLGLQDPGQLVGTFPFNETLDITNQAAVNGICGTSLSGAVQTMRLTDTGFWTFDGKGNMSITDHGSVATNPVTDASDVQPAAATCSGTYSVSGGTSLDLHYVCALNSASFVVHTRGVITPFNILVEAAANPDGSPLVGTVSVANKVVACSEVAEDTVVSRVVPNQSAWPTGH